MSKYLIESSDGRKVTVSGPYPPSEAEIEAIFDSIKAPSREARPEGPRISAQPERGVVENVRNWMTGAASDRRIADQEREGLQEAGVGVHPTAGQMLTGVAGIAAVPAMAATPGVSLLGMTTGVPGAIGGERLARAVGEKIGPGVGDITGPAGGIGGGLATGGAGASLVRGGGRAVADTARLGAEMSRTATEVGARMATASKGAVSRGAAKEMVLEGLLDTGLSFVPGGNLAGGLVRRGARSLYGLLRTRAAGQALKQKAATTAVKAAAPKPVTPPKAPTKATPVTPPKAPTAEQVADEVVKRIEPTKARTLDPLKGVDFNKAGGKKAQMAAVEAKAQYEGRGFVPGVGERPQGSFEPIKGAVKKAVTKAASPGAVRAAEHKQLVAFAKQEAKGYKAGEKVWMELDKSGQPVRVITPGQASALDESLKTWIKKAWSD